MNQVHPTITNLSWLKLSKSISFDVFGVLFLLILHIILKLYKYFTVNMYLKLQTIDEIKF